LYCFLFTGILRLRKVDNWGGGWNGPTPRLTATEHKSSGEDLQRGKQYIPPNCEFIDHLIELIVLLSFYRHPPHQQIDIYVGGGTRKSTFREKDEEGGGPTPRLTATEHTSTGYDLQIGKFCF